MSSVPVTRDPAATAARDLTALRPSPGETARRPRVCGPSLFVGNQKWTVRAVTYGTFAADAAGDRFPRRGVVRRDFAMMCEAGVNCIRTYTTPPDWLFEEARQAGLRVLVGIYWGGEDCDFDDRMALRRATDAVRDAVSRCRRFDDVVLAYLIGNEIPPLVVRFHGWRTISNFLARLCTAVKEIDADALVSYGNFPSTEYLQLDFLDFYTLNVYLLERDKLGSYLDRMMIESKGKPLLLGEIGDDSLHKDQRAQAEVLDWTIPLALDKGVAGVCVFSWTDDWVVGDHAIEDWDFGIVDRQRRPKQAYQVVRRRFGQTPTEMRGQPWPGVSVVVCNYNGGETLDETLRSLLVLDYPNYEVVYVDDGSTDASLRIAERYAERIRIIAQANHGLSVARNVGARAATGEIIAYTDSDAFADRDWLRHLVASLESDDYAAVGGPNLTPESDGLTAQLIALSPGNPTFVLKDNVEADHIAGVNMAFRREALATVGGFDPVHRRAGDDVDICWRLMDSGHRIAFSPAAIVWHHRRPSIYRYFKQQAGYGEAENQLERKHPERFNLGGYIRWSGRVYAAPRSVSRLLKPFIYHGELGEGLFQTLYQKEPSFLLDGPQMIQWYGLWIGLLALSPFSIWCLGIGLVLMAFSIWAALFAGLTTQVPKRLRPRERLIKVLVISWLHFLHPVVRTWGRVAARVRTARPMRHLPRIRWLAPGYLLLELAWFFRRPKQTRGYWGIGTGQREAFLRDVQAETKRVRIGALFGREWDNNDLTLQGSLACQGRLYTAPEHFDQSLRVGYRACSTGLWRVAMALTIALACYVSLTDSRWLPAFALPAAIGVLALAERARMRARVWRCVELAAAAHGASWHDRGGGQDGAAE